MRRLGVVVSVLGVMSGLVVLQLRADDKLRQQSTEAVNKGIAFYHQKVAVHGGYVYQYSDDLQKREGEGKTDLHTVWVQPPGTPTVGDAYLQVYERTGDKASLAAARDAALCLLQGQYKSGGWNDRIDFDPALRKRHDFRLDKTEKKRPRNVTTFDDQKTQAALSFLMRFDRAMKFQDREIHEAAEFALLSILQAQFPNGAFAQGYSTFPDPAKFPVIPAKFPESWPRTYPGGDYWDYYTLNDNSLADVIEMLLLAHEIYDDVKFQQAAFKAGDFLLLAQLPEPQPAWAQQYNFQMEPIWARKFEPASITGGESQGVIKVLLRLYVVTGDKKYLKPIPSALDYLQKSEIAPGKLARFYELKTNKPLYFTKTYELTYDDSDLPTHYGFQIDSKVPQLRKSYEQTLKMTPAQLEKARQPKVDQPKLSPALEQQVREIIAAQDKRGAWVIDGQLKYHGKGDPTRRIISSAHFAKQVDLLSQYLSASAGK